MLTNNSQSNDYLNKVFRLLIFVEFFIVQLDSKIFFWLIYILAFKFFEFKRWLMGQF
ncbi:hypothetical protein LYNGBM3L_30060 [Moorena producens 3L]|uniref:Uncharacterized protein n=1 Tax=Moorena producens 3L TaxID=489825 RepID=F4XPD4_9CYAN|nr:hypothetical protein LYNGBM3L_30060 [Moorena producens 3L]